MKILLPAASALALLVTPLAVLGAPSDQPAPAGATATARSAPSPADADTPLPAPPKVTRWEDTGMKPATAREWQNYGFSPQEGINWRSAGFEPVVARTWSDKGFDAEEAREWRDSARMSRTMMAEMDHADPASWKREGFTPADRLAWWEAGFVFDDAVLLARTGMTPAQAAWHGHEKLKELRGAPPGAAPGTQAAAPAAPALPGAAAPQGPAGAAQQPAMPPLDAASVWRVVGPFLKVGLVGLIAFIAGGFAFFLYRRAQVNSKLASIKPDAPDSEMPAASPRLGKKVMEKRKPARAVKLFKTGSPRCIHCKSENVRRSRMHPHKFIGINFTEYFRCKSCGRHFAIVSYTPILLTAGSIVLALILVTASFIYLFSVG